MPTHLGKMEEVYILDDYTDCYLHREVLVLLVNILAARTWSFSGATLEDE